jgi:hypothetical protein
MVELCPTLYFNLEDWLHHLIKLFLWLDQAHNLNPTQAFNQVVLVVYLV